jgi:predicted amidophosphoribosyltransferase
MNITPISAPLMCRACGLISAQISNFCINCGTKLVKVCDCWVKKEPYDCGQEKCPGHRLFLEMKKSYT